MYKQHAVEHRIESTIDILYKSHQVLRHYQAEPVINIGYLEGIAGIRFAMMEVATLLYILLGGIQETFSCQQNHLALQLIQIAEEVCTDPHINTTNFAESDAIGPAVYLLKLLVRQYGFSCLKKVSTEYQWVVPRGLRTANQVWGPYL